MDVAQLIIRISGDVSDAEKKLRGISLPLAALGGFALKSSIDFESAFAGVRKTVDATEEQFAALESGIRKMATEIPVAATEIARIGEAAGQLGIDAEHILGFSRVMADLGVATNMASDDAATALARLANITQMPQTEFDRLGSTVVHLGNNLATTESEIVEFGLRLAGAGKTVGMTEAEILALGGALSSLGINAEAGGTAMSRAVITIAKEVETGGERLEKFAAVAGQTAEEFARSFKSNAAGAMVDFIEGLGSAANEGESLFLVLQDLGMQEIRLRDSLLRSANAGDTLREAIELGTTAWEENNALTKEAEQRYGTTASQLQVLWNRVKDVAITFGDELVPALLSLVDAAEPVLGFVSDAVNAFAALPQPVKTFLIALGGILAVAAPVIFVIGKVVGVVGTIVGAFSAVATFLGGLGLVLGVSIGWIIAIVLAVIAVAYLLWKHWDTIWPWVSDLVEAVAGWIQRNLANIVSWLFPLIGAVRLVAEHWDTIWGWVKSIVGMAVGWVGTKLGELVEWFMALPGRILGALGDIGRWLFDAGKDLVRGLIDGIKNMAGAALDAAKSVVRGAVNGVKSFLGISSPSRLFMEIGSDTMVGLAIGVQAEEDRIRAVLANMVGTFADARPSISIAPAPAPAVTAGTGFGGGPPQPPLHPLVLSVDGRELAEVLTPHMADGLHHIDTINDR